MGKLFYIMGKSASGKDTIYKELLKRGEPVLIPVVLYTTRPIRQGEAHGKEYYFVGEEDFLQMKETGKLIEARSYDTVHGVWRYFTADNGQLNLEENNYLGIGTLESFCQLLRHYGKEKICPIYIHVPDGVRLRRAIDREEKQRNPVYEEVCRRFLADSKDFSETKLNETGILKRFLNVDRDTCLAEIEKYMKDML